MKNYTNMLFLLIFSISGTLINAMEIDIHEACRNGEFETVKRYLDNGGDINAQDEMGNTLLHDAVEHPPLVLFLLNKNASIEVKNSFGSTPLHKAAEGGCLESIKLFIEKGTNVNAQADFGMTLLDKASFNGHYSTVKFLLKNKAAINPEGSNIDWAIPPIPTKGTETIYAILTLLKLYGVPFNENIELPEDVSESYPEEAIAVIHNIAGGGKEYLKRIPTSENSLLARAAQVAWQKRYHEKSLTAAKIFDKKLKKEPRLPQNQQGKK